MKKILLIIGILLAFGLTAFVIMWNKPHRDIDSEESTAVPADTLFNNFASDENAANAKYLDKVIEIKGKVKEVSENQSGNVVVTLQLGNPESSIQCTMRNGEKAKPATGSNVTIKGFCNGYMDITGEVLLSDCAII